MRRTAPFALMLVLAVPTFIRSDERPVPQPKIDLRARLDDDHWTDLWIYNDIAAARRQAKEVGRPVFVTFRCVPCKSCSGFDAEVARDSDAVRRLARERFVSVRQVEMKGVDLSLFQFDHDLNWAAMFIHHDGTVLARYGTQSAAGADAYNSVESLEKTMRRVLELYKEYPTNRAELAGKTGAPKPYKTALEMPGLDNKERYRGETKRNNCIHCHNIHDAENRQAWREGRLNADLMYRYPLPENIGLTIDPKDGLAITKVASGSPAARAGIRAGESLSHANGQRLTSIADLQWVLHNLNPKNAKVVLRCEGDSEGRTLTLTPGWKKTDFSWRGSIWGQPPRLAVWMPKPTDADRKKYALPRDREGLVVKWMNEDAAGGRAAKKAGLRYGDLIVKVGDKPVGPWGPRQFTMHVKLNYRPGDTLPLTVLRSGKEREVRIVLTE